MNNIILEYSIDGGSTWTNIDSNVSPESLSYQWTVPDEASSSSLIRARESGIDANFDTSDAVFTIEPIPTEIIPSISKANLKRTSPWKWGQDIFFDPNDLSAITIPARYNVSVKGEIVAGPLLKKGLKIVSMKSDLAVLTAGSFSLSGTKDSIYPDEAINMIVSAGVQLPDRIDYNYRPRMRTYTFSGNNIVPKKEWMHSYAEKENCWSLTKEDMPSLVVADAVTDYTVVLSEYIEADGSYYFKAPEFPIAEIISCSASEYEVFPLKGLIKTSNPDPLTITYKAAPVFTYVPKDKAFEVTTFNIDAEKNKMLMLSAEAI